MPVGSNPSITQKPTAIAGPAMCMPHMRGALPSIFVSRRSSLELSGRDTTLQLVNPTQVLAWTSCQAASWYSHEFQFVGCNELVLDLPSKIDSVISQNRYSCSPQVREGNRRRATEEVIKVAEPIRQQRRGTPTVGGENMGPLMMGLPSWPE